MVTPAGFECDRRERAYFLKYRHYADAVCHILFLSYLAEGSNRAPDLWRPQNMADSAIQPKLVPIASTATYELVTEQLLRAINMGRIAVGEKLPSERSMAEQFQVSRATVREAVRALETSGILEVKKGATGGARVLKRGSINGPGEPF